MYLLVVHIFNSLPVRAFEYAYGVYAVKYVFVKINNMY